jgi:hypothetical protein
MDNNHSDQSVANLRVIHIVELLWISVLKFSDVSLFHIYDS